MIKRALFILSVTALLYFPLTVIYAHSNDSLPVKTERKSGNKVSAEEIPSVSISVDRNKANVGDLINLIIRYNLPKGSNFNESEFEGLEGLTVIGRNSSNGEIKLTLLIDKIKDFKIGPVSLTFKDKKGELNIIKSEVLDIAVLSNLGNKPAEAGLKPIMDIIPTYPLWLRILPYGLGILGVLIIIAGILYWNKRRSLQKQSLTETKPPHIIANEDLKKLMLMKLIENGRHKEFYFRFSEILRVYIERLRGFPAAEMTSEEIIKKIKDERDRQLIPLFRESDLVKFADMIPSNAKTEEDIKTALRYIKDTTPVPAVAEHSS